MEEPIEPSALEYALHGRLIKNTPYKNIWNTTIILLTQLIGGPIITRLSNADVRFDLQICDTACIANHSKIFVNPVFFHKYLNDPHNFAGVLLHELLHPFVDPFMEKKGVLWNYITDVLINATVHEISPKLTAWMPTFYRNNHFPSILLCHSNHAVWQSLHASKKYCKERKKPEDVTEDEFDGLTFPVQKTHLEAYYALYPTGHGDPKDKPSLEDIYQLFFKQDEEAYQGTPRIGVIVTNSSGQGKGEGGGITISQEELERAKASGEVVEIELEMDKDSNTKDSGKEDSSSPDSGKEDSTSTSAGKDGTLEKKKVNIFEKSDIERTVRNSVETGIDVYKSLPDKIKQNKSPVMQGFKKVFEELDPGSVISRAFKNTALPDVRNIISNNLADTPQSDRSLIPLNVGRSGLFYMSQGIIPVWWKSPQVDSDTEESGTTAVYVDVSGSFMGFIPWTLGLINQLEGRCRLKELFVFSTEVVPVTMEQISNGEYYSTGGTSFNDVVSHFLELDIPKALVITDGYDSLNKSLKDQLESSNKELHVLLISYSENPETKHLDWAKQVYTHSMGREY